MSIEVRAQNTISMTSVKAIKDATDQSAQLLAEMEDYAEQAGTTLTGIYQDAEDAKASAISAQASADSASEYASRALGNLSTVQSVTETLTWITQHGTMTLTTDIALDPTHVYFVADANGDYVVGNNHYSIVTEPDVADIATYYELSIDESLNNYVGTHLALNSEGLWLLPATTGTNKVLIATGAGSTYTTAGTYIIDSNNDALASFRADGAQVGIDANGQTRTVLNTDGMQVITKNSQGTEFVVAHLGYGACIDAGGNTTNAPYYNIGKRKSATSIGVRSVAEGYDTTASKYGAHAEGYGTTASGAYSHAEGYRTTASGEGAHAEGGGTTTASGIDAHAEGVNTKASGAYSHAQNDSTIAQRMSQTALGAYNRADTSGAGVTEKGDYIVIVGNGTSNVARSNALTLDWQGRIECGDYSGQLKSIFDIFYPVGSFYETSDTTFDPNTAWGGTWSLETEGLVHIGAGTNYTAGATGGEASHILTEAEMPSHTHSQGTRYGATLGAYEPSLPWTSNSGTFQSWNCVATTGGGQAHNNMQPYVVVNRWHRTA